MTSMHSAIPEEKLTEAYRLLLEMRGNCVKHADDQYDDPKREAKYEALNIAMDAMGRSIPPRWISVEERLPEKTNMYLAHLVHSYNHEDEYSCVTACFFDPNMRPKWVIEGNLYKVTHWMPLPELPKEE